MERCNSEKVKMKTCFADKDLSSWTGLGRSGHVQIPTFGSISHFSGRKLIVLGNFQTVVHGLAWRSSKKHYFFNENGPGPENPRKFILTGTF